MPGNAAKKMATTIEELKDKLVKLNEHAKGLQAAADAETRDLTAEEKNELDAVFEAFNATESEIARRERIEEQERRLQTPSARLVPDDEPDGDEGDDDEPEKPHPFAAKAPGSGNIAPSRPARSPARHFTQVENKGTWGWRSFGEYASAVRASVRGKVDPRLIANAPTTYGQEGVNTDGGYAIPPDFRQDILLKVLGEDSLIGRTDQQTTSSNQITVPIDESTPWAAAGGLQVAWEAEAQQHGQSKPQLAQITCRAYKLAALVPVTEELLEDASAMANYLRRKVPDKFTFKMNDAIINGNGTGQPLGLMNAAAKITVPKEAAQPTGTVTLPNIVKMWGRMYGQWRRNAVWLINQDVEQQLQQLTVGGGGWPAYLPPGGLSQSPYATLFGRPIIVTESCQGLSTEGDIILTDLTQYLTVMKAGGLRQDVSIHLWFDYDMTAFRFIMRVGGQPWWSTPIVRKNSALQLSSIVTLQTR